VVWANPDHWRGGRGGVVLQGFGSSADLDATRRPWRHHVVDHDGGAAGPLHVSCSALYVQPTGTTCGMPSAPTVAMRASRRSPVMYAISSGLKALIRLLRRRRVRRRPEDQHAQVFFDVVKTVLDSGRHEDQAARLDRPVLARDPDRAAPADHVVHLVFQVRMLAVGLPFRPDRETDAQPVRGEEVDVAVTVGVARLWVQVGNIECIHRLSLPW